ncbi:MAG: RsmE family RNA methyltransferase [Syntrophobacteraceae bacterium]
MARRCFFVERVEPDAEIVNLSAEASHHLESVLRLKTGEAVEIRDGLGNAWTGEITRIHKGSAAVRLVGRLDASFLESPLDITLALGFVRSDIMDQVVRQATEMGVRRIAAFRAARSQYALAGVRAEKKVGRWLKIAREAVCQCGRNRAPEISIFGDLDRFLGSLPPSFADEGGVLRVLALEGERDRGLDRLKVARPVCSGVLAAIGPEGGWDDSEIAGLIGAGFHPIHLGPRILRFETAAVALIGSIQLLWGDFGETGRKGREK